MKKRFIITINEEEDDFIVETPDGEVGLDYLIDVLDLIYHDLSHMNEDNNSNASVVDDDEEKTPTENRSYTPLEKKDLN